MFKKSRFIDDAAECSDDPISDWTASYEDATQDTAEAEAIDLCESSGEEEAASSSRAPADARQPVVLQGAEDVGRGPSVPGASRGGATAAVRTSLGLAGTRLRRGPAGPAVHPSRSAGPVRDPEDGPGGASPSRLGPSGRADGSGGSGPSDASVEGNDGRAVAAAAGVRSSRSRNWCFTLQLGPGGGPSHGEVRGRLAGAGSAASGVAASVVRACVYQLERAPQTGRLHYQGFVQFCTHQTLGQVKAVFSPWAPHLEIMRGTVEQAVAYCKKEDSRVDGPWEWGEFASQGKRAVPREETLRLMKEFVGAGGTLKAARQDPRFVNLFYSNNALTTEIFGDMLAETMRPTGFPTLRRWQAALAAQLEMPPDNRAVYWFFDRIGGSGKSSFAIHMAARHGEAIFITDGAGHLADLKYSWRQANQGASVSVVFIDMSRCQEQMTGAIYRFIETVKNNWCSTTKYQSSTFFTKPCHVVCFANNPPQVELLSMDRWRIFELCPSHGDWSANSRAADMYVRSDSA